jgi:glycosyltransferase involved in cell wall biosynthesis
VKILFIQKVKALVGSEKYFLELIPELEKRGVKTEFICVYLEKDEEKTMPFIEAYQKLGLPLHILKAASDKEIFRICRFIDRIYKKGCFDIVHSHLIHADLWCALLKAAGRIKVPLVSTKHGYDEAYISVHGFSAEHLKPNLYYLLCKFSEKFIDSSFAVSEGLRKLFVEGGIAKSENIRTIHHGFELPVPERKLNSEYRFAEHQLVILGRVIPFKGHHLLIEALKTVKQQIPAFKLLVVGHGDADYILGLKEKIKEYGLTENVEFLGYRSNIYDYLINSDVMIVPSISEGFGLVFLEALNARIPLVGFDVPATNEIIIHEQTGLLVPPFDCEKMGEAILELLKDKEKAVRFTAAGYERLKEYFSLKRMIDETIEFYNDAYKKRTERRQDNDTHR